MSEPPGIGVPPRQPGRAVGNLAGALRAGAVGLGGEETGLHEGAHVVEHRPGVDLEQFGELLVRAGLERAQAQDAQPCRGAQRPDPGLGGRIVLVGDDPLFAHTLTLAD